MTKIFNTWILPSGHRVEQILNSIQPPLSEQQTESARAMIRELELFVKSSTFVLDNRGKLVLDSGWLTEEFNLDDWFACFPWKVQFDFTAQANACGQVTLKGIANLYWEELLSTRFKEEIDSDQMIDDFREERIQEQWPVARQREIQASVFDEVSKFRSGKITAKEMFQSSPEEPTDLFRARYTGW
jgi:hypothetical protein